MQNHRILYKQNRNTTKIRVIVLILDLVAISYYISHYIFIEQIIYVRISKY